jgi:hypothetical protein
MGLLVVVLVFGYFRLLEHARFLVALYVGVVFGVVSVLGTWMFTRPRGRPSN